MAAKGPHVAVIGAGIIGASIATNLTNKGCKVTVFDSATRAAEGATSKSWAWLNANRKTPAHYKELNKAGMEEWKALTNELEHNEAIALFPGTLYIGDDREIDPAYPSSRISPSELQGLEPELATRYTELGGRLYEQEGYAYPAQAASNFLQQAEDGGAELRFSSEVTRVLSQDGRATGVETSGGANCAADIVVIAAGLGTPVLASKVGSRIPLSDKPGTLTILTQPLPKFLQHIIVTDEAFILQRRDGEVMISFFKAAVNHHPNTVTAKATPVDHGETDIAQRVEESARQECEGHSEAAAELLNESDEIALREIARAAKICPFLRDASLGSYSVAKYPYPVDAHPILGWLPEAGNVYVAVTHSGATLGPLLGRLVAEEVLGKDQKILQPYRPDRKFGDLSHLY